MDPNTTTNELITSTEAVSLEQNDGNNRQETTQSNGKKPRKKREKKITANDTYKCDLCDFKTGYIGMFDRHIKMHTTNELKLTQFKCKYCDKSFKDQPSLTNHSNVHLGIKPFKCTTCENYFGTKGELDRHIKYRHTQDKPQKCPECDYSTVEKTKLKRHMRVHTKERPYMCGFCDYASSDTFRLKRHLRTHTGERPYECPHCKKSFAQSNTLKAHIRVFHQPVEQTGTDNAQSEPSSRKRKRRAPSLAPNPKLAKLSASESSENSKLSASVEISITNNDENLDANNLFECSECFMKFLTKELLQEHYVKHTGDRPFECEICQLRFSHKFALRAHKRSHDPSYLLRRREQTPKTRNPATRWGGRAKRKEKSVAEINTDSDDSSNQEPAKLETTRTETPDSVREVVGSSFHVAGESNQLNSMKPEF